MSAPENAPVRLGLAGNGQAAVVVYVGCQAVPPARLHRGPRASRPTGASLGLSVAVDRRSWRLRSSSCKHHRTLDFQPVLSDPARDPAPCRMTSSVCARSLARGSTGKISSSKSLKVHSIFSTHNKIAPW